MNVGLSVVSVISGGPAGEGVAASIP